VSVLWCRNGGKLFLSSTGAPFPSKGVCLLQDGAGRGKDEEKVEGHPTRQKESAGQGRGAVGGNAPRKEDVHEKESDERRQHVVICKGALLGEKDIIRPEGKKEPGASKKKKWGGTTELI